MYNKLIFKITAKFYLKLKLIIHLNSNLIFFTICILLRGKNHTYYELQIIMQICKKLSTGEVFTLYHVTK